jgi:hypothetical protein
LEIFRGYWNITPSVGYLNIGNGFPGANAKHNLDELQSIVFYARIVKEAR